MTKMNIYPEDEFMNDGVLWKRIPKTRVWCSADGKHIAKWVESSKKFRDYFQSNDHGYKTVAIVIDGKKYCTTSHRVIAYCFGILDSLDSKLDVDHINNIRNDNRIENLQAITHAENIAKRDKNGHALARPVSFFKGKEMLYFNSCTEAAKYFVENGISKGTLASTKVNISLCDYPYGYQKIYADLFEFEEEYCNA